MGTSSTDWSLFFHQTSFIINTLLSHPCERSCAPLTQNSMLKRRSSSHMPWFSLSPAKQRPSGGAKQWNESVLNQESQKQGRRDSSSCLAVPFEFILTLISAHIALN